MNHGGAETAIQTRVAKPLGAGPRPAVYRCRDDDIGDVMCDGVGGAQCPCRFSEGSHPDQRLLVEVGQVVDDVRGEQLRQPVEAAVVDEGTM